MSDDLDWAIVDILKLTEPLLHIPADRRHDGDPEVAGILRDTTTGQMEQFLERWGRRPDEIVVLLFEDYLASVQEGRFAVEPRPLVFNGRVDTDIGARVRLKGADPRRGPFLYLYIGAPAPPVRRVVEFGMRFGPLTTDQDACVRMLNEPDVRELTDRAMAENIDMTSVYGSDVNLEGDDDAHISMEPTWGHRAAFTVGYSSTSLPNGLTRRFLDTVASLWEPFLRTSLA